MRISLLHTGEIHIASFQKLFDEFGEGIELSHHVEEGLLKRAQLNGVDEIREDTREALEALAGADAVLCTCSSLGPVTDEVSRKMGHIVRIDRPLMEAACQDGAHILVAICVASTRGPTLDLLHEVAQGLGKEVSPDVLLISSAWPHFEAGDMNSYWDEIAKVIKQELETRSETDVVVLAQASMRGAQEQLAGIGVPVRSSPRLAVERAIERAKERVG